MRVDFVSGGMNASLGKPGVTGENQSFTEVLKEKMTEINDMQIASEESSEALAMGEAENIHEVMIQTEEAKLALELAVQVRNKVVEA